MRRTVSTSNLETPPVGAVRYVEALCPLLPADAFRPVPARLSVLFLHLGVVLAGYWITRLAPPFFLPVITLIMGHSMACIGFLAHELSHNSIVTHRQFRYLFELLFWGLILIPPTVWRRVHNHTHHLQTNTLGDPDRSFTVEERSRLTRWYTRIFYPYKSSFRWNPLVLLHLIPYIGRNVVSAFYPGGSKPACVPNKPAYTSRERRYVALELVIIACFQIGIFWSVGTWWHFFWVSPAAYAVTSAVVMAYIFTNHFLNPVSATHDQLLNTTTVSVNPWLDRIHHHFSHHTEHHLFPGMNSDFYPRVSRLLEELYPDRYHRLSIGKAWQMLWNRKQFDEVPQREPPVVGKL